MTEISPYLFYFLAVTALFGGVGVIAFRNPIYSALCLAGTMVSVACLFVTMNAYFIAGVQVAVYAGAVIVLFVMVLMLFDLSSEKRAFSGSVIGSFLKVASLGFFAGLLGGAIYLSGKAVHENAGEILASMNVSKQVATLLFTKYLFGFEAIGVLLLVVCIGAVALARSVGGTHAVD